MTMFDALRIPRKIDLLKKDLKLKNTIKMTNEDNIVLENFDDIHLAPIGIRRSPPFYLFLRLEGWVVDNCMIDIGVASTVIPKAIVDEMKLYITLCIDEFI